MATATNAAVTAISITPVRTTTTATTTRPHAVTTAVRVVVRSAVEVRRGAAVRLVAAALAAVHPQGV